MENHSEVNAPIKFASILIKNIFINKLIDELNFQLQVGKSVITKNFRLNQSQTLPYFFPITSRGFLFSYSDYIIFIVPQLELSEPFKSTQSHTDESIAYFKPGFWFVEQIRIFGDYKVYFLKHGLRDSQEFTYFNLAKHKYLQNIYHTIPQIGTQTDFFIKLRLENGIEYLVKINETQIKIPHIEKEITIYIGVIEAQTIFSHLFIFATKDLIYLQNSRLSKNNLRFAFDGKYFNVPNLPILNGGLSTEFELSRHYTEFIDRSKIISFSYSLNEKISPQDAILERSDIIDLSDACEKIKDYTEVFDLIALTNSVEEDFWKGIRELEWEEMPYKLALTIYSESSSVRLNLSNLSDYEEYYKPIDNSDQNSSWDEVTEISEEDKVWGGLNNDERWHYDPERALDEAWNEPLDSLDEPEYNSDEDIRYGEQNIFYQDIFKIKKELLKKISVVSLSDSEIRFEIEKESDLFTSTIVSIHPFKFVRGIKVFTGMLEYEKKLNIPFAIIARYSKAAHKNILHNLLNYRKYVKIKSNHFYIYFNLEYDQFFCGDCQDYSDVSKPDK